MSKHISYNPKNTGKEEISYLYMSEFSQYIWVGIFCFKKGDKLHKKMHIYFCSNGYIISSQITIKTSQLKISSLTRIIAITSQ